MSASLEDMRAKLRDSEWEKLYFFGNRKTIKSIWHNQRDWLYIPKRESFVQGLLVFHRRLSKYLLIYSFFLASNLLFLITIKKDGFWLKFISFFRLYYSVYIIALLRTLICARRDIRSNRLSIRREAQC